MFSFNTFHGHQNFLFPILRQRMARSFSSNTAIVPDKDFSSSGENMFLNQSGIAVKTILFVAWSI